MRRVAKLIDLTPNRKQQGQSTVEMAFMLPIFLGVLFGLAAFSVLFFSYVTIQLAVREATSAAVHDTHKTVDQIRTIACNGGINLWQSQMTVQVEPGVIDGTPVSCSNPNMGGSNAGWVSGHAVQVNAFYLVPLPTIKIPLNNNGSAVLLAPINIKAVSIMTIE